MPTTKTWGYQDYAALDDGKRYEVIDGELIEMASAPNEYHQSTSGSLFGELYLWLKKNGKGTVRSAPYDVILADDHVFQPDIVYISNERKSIITERGAEGAPDLCIEILSPSTVKHDTGIKVQRYFQFGVTEYWIVDPRTHTIDVMVRGEDCYFLAQRFGLDDTLVSELFPGFELKLSEVFA